MKLLLLHPLPLDGSVFSDDLRSLVDDCVAPTLYAEGADLAAWAVAALDAVGDGPVVIAGNSIGGSCAIEVAMLAPKKSRGSFCAEPNALTVRNPTVRDQALDVLECQGIDIAWERYWRPLFGPDASAAVVEQGRRTAQKIGAPLVAAGVRAFHGRADREDFLLRWTGLWCSSTASTTSPSGAGVSPNGSRTGPFTRSAVLATTCRWKPPKL